MDLWLKRDSLEDIAKAFNIDIVPIILKGTLQEAVDYVKSKPNFFNLFSSIKYLAYNRGVLSLLLFSLYANLIK